MQERNPHALKKAVGHDVESGGMPVTFRNGMVQQVKAHAQTIVASHGERHRSPDAGHAGQGTHAPKELADEPIHLIGTVPRFRKVEMRRKQMARVKAQIYVGERFKAANHKASAYEQHNSERCLCNHQNRTNAVVGGTSG